MLEHDFFRPPKSSGGPWLGVKCTAHASRRDVRQPRSCCSYGLGYLKRWSKIYLWRGFPRDLPRFFRSHACVRVRVAYLSLVLLHEAIRSFVALSLTDSFCVALLY